ncbi:hypothetical protein EVAR_32576_1 [Eumeta japonica]|uniref:Uncharacterized protein n=1 Tax=Eumeta variegata TaxID=151549 RepID=A0A4C1VR17_EUMVA|nr:hypothetical protein EVAR_32576_1 [Eumeta japonica]
MGDTRWGPPPPPRRLAAALVQLRSASEEVAYSHVLLREPIAPRRISNQPLAVVGSLSHLNHVVRLDLPPAPLTLAYNVPDYLAATTRADMDCLVIASSWQQWDGGGQTHVRRQTYAYARRRKKKLSTYIG